MKIIIIISAIAIVVILIFLALTFMSANKTETQKYDVILKDKDLEIRFYPSATIATIASSAKSYEELSSSGFRKLAGYIFGGNEAKTQISMTSPVQMDINDTVSTMSFVMPSAYNQANLPKPNNPDVIIKETPNEYVAAIQFGGFASDKELKKYAEKLFVILKEKGYKSIGNPRFLGYNPPYQLLGRKNEMVIAIVY
ncbi:MAG: SOUL family heme-binding protein [Paludibacter sp.]